MPFRRLALLSLVALLRACGSEQNDPYPRAERGAATSCTPPSPSAPSISIRCSPTARTRSPSLYQIYEPPLQYHYLKRPYVLEPATADGMPAARLDATGASCPADAPIRPR
jgi:oligopeptide transport system substrate-binding protein